MITITIVPQTQAQIELATKFLKDYPVLTPLENFKIEAPKTAPRASSAKASPAPAPTQTESLSLVEVRAKLSALSQAGKKDDIAALIATFGAAKLTEVKPEDYAALLAKAEKL
jgi:hypothetical protein